MDTQSANQRPRPLAALSIAVVAAIGFGGVSLLAPETGRAGASPALSGNAQGADKGVGVMSLVHIGVPVSDLNRALHFYVDQLGLKEAYRLKNPDGSLGLVYLQINNSGTFVELFPGTKKAEMPAMPVHYHMGLRVRDLQSSLRALQASGYPLPANAFEEAGKLAGDGTHYYFVEDPDGNHIELSQIGPDSLQAKVSKALNR